MGAQQTLRRCGATTALGLLLILGAPDFPSAQLPLMEEEVYGYLSGFFDALKSCNTEWFQSQFLTSAQVEFSSSRGETYTLTPAGYLEEIRKYCQPYEFVKWDRTSTQVTTDNDSATVQWKLWWGRQPEGSKLVFHETTNLVKEGWTLHIAGMSSKTEELVPGAEDAYYHRRSPDLLEMAIRFYRKLIGQALIGKKTPHSTRGSQ